MGRAARASEIPAEVWGQIAKWHLDGKNAPAIVNELARLGVPSPRGKARWNPQTIRRVIESLEWEWDEESRNASSASPIVCAPIECPPIVTIQLVPGPAVDMFGRRVRPPA